MRRASKTRIDASSCRRPPGPRADWKHGWCGTEARCRHGFGRGCPSRTRETVGPTSRPHGRRMARRRNQGVWSGWPTQGGWTRIAHGGLSRWRSPGTRPRRLPCCGICGRCCLPWTPVRGSWSSRPWIGWTRMPCPTPGRCWTSYRVTRTRTFRETPAACWAALRIGEGLSGTTPPSNNASKRNPAMARATPVEAARGPAARPVSRFVPRALLATKIPRVETRAIRKTRHQVGRPSPTWDPGPHATGS